MLAHNSADSSTNNPDPSTPPEPKIGGLMGSVYDCGPCPYLPGRDFRALVPVDDMHAAYHQLMEHGFRRNGAMIYRPHCEHCNACSATRVDTQAFSASRSQKRCAKRNRDIEITQATHECSAERQDLFLSYESVVHKREDAVLDMLDESGGQNCIELHARSSTDGRLLAVSIIDVFVDSISSVYCYFDPNERQRSLGTYMALQEIEYCRQQQLSWLYLGYYVQDCQKLAYKANFTPLQIFDGETWNWSS